ncbi:MAG: pilus assembly protein [Chloroflexi bacterium]|nr:pilus assembly protein [Chloroflexota bacterium]
MVEFALLLPIFLAVLFLIIDFGVGINRWVIVTNSTREGARIGAVGASSIDIADRVASSSNGLLDAADVTVSYSGDGDGAVDRLVHRVAVPQLVDRLVHVLLIDLGRLKRDPQSLIVAEFDRRAHRHRRLERQRFRARHLDLRLVDGVDLVLFQGLVVGLRHEEIDRLLEEPFAADVAFQHGAGRLPLTEARNVDALD